MMTEECSIGAHRLGEAITGFVPKCGGGGGVVTMLDERSLEEKH